MSESETIFDAFTEAATRSGYQQKSGAWYREVPVGLHVLSLQKSTWGDQYDVNLGVYVRDLGPARWPRVHKCHFYTRGSSLGGSESRWRETFDAETELCNRREQVSKLLGQFVFPFLSSIDTKEGLRNAHAEVLLANGLMLKALRQYLAD